jgi:hypothetical protein
MIIYDHIIFDHPLMDVQWIFPAAPIKAMPSNPRLQAVAGASPWHCTGVPQLCPALATALKQVGK